MKNIGQRIKELRKKNDLTQEKLADFLGVTYQSVSKWETGLTYPDLSLIVPLARVLHVSTDELLGATSETEDKERTKYNDAYLKYKNCDDHEKSYWFAREAVNLFPNDFRYTEWLARAEYKLAFNENLSESGDVDYFNGLIENALRRYESIINMCDEPEIIRQAIIGKIGILRFAERIDEAEWSAEFEYPDPRVNTVDEVLRLSDEGRKLLQYLNNEKIIK